MLFDIEANEVAQDVMDNWGWFVFLGVLMIMAGTAAIGHPGLATVLTVGVLGWLLVFAGFVQGFASFFAKSWGGFFFEIIVAILYVMAGFAIINNPAMTSVWVTAIVALAFVAGGTVRVFESIAMAGNDLPAWGWVLLAGLTGVFVGVAIFSRWPDSSAGAVGLLVGIALLVNGISGVFLGVGAGIAHHRLKKAAGG